MTGYSTQEVEVTEPFRRALRDAVSAIDGAGIPYLVMGGVGSATIGRPRWTHDIDLFIPPDARKPTLEVLADVGFKTEETNPRWLYKAWKYDVLVDIIFKSAGDVYLDEAMLERGTMHELDGCRARIMSPEDLIVIKAVTAAEHVPHHWHDALGLVSKGELDWDYLVQRARRHGIRRVLSLLIFAESNDIWVPPGRIRELFAAVHECTEKAL